MNDQNFTTSFTVEQSPERIFNAINDVRGWWTEGIEGDIEKVNDEFSVRFWDVHYSKHKLVEVIPYSKIVWLITDAKLTFVEKEDEWIGDRIIFDIIPHGNKTEVCFTQIGLTPAMECFSNCSNAWTGYVTGSLKQFIETGVGKPTTLEQLSK